MTATTTTTVATVASVRTAPRRFRTTRRGRVVRDVSERYLRRDLGLGFVASSSEKDEGGDGRTCVRDVDHLLSLLPSSDDPLELVVVDANVLLHNADVLERASSSWNVVVPTTALGECRRHSITAYDRASRSLTERRAKGTGRAILFPDEHHAEVASAEEGDDDRRRDTPNDRNDARIRRVARFLGRRTASTRAKVVLLTDDAACRRAADAENEREPRRCYEARSVRRHVEIAEKRDPSLDLSDSLARFGADDAAADDDASERFSYAPHLSAAEISDGVRAGRLFSGHLRCRRGGAGWTDCHVTVRRGNERTMVVVRGAADVNRAVSGDHVAVEIKPESEWVGRDAPKPDKKRTAAGIAADTAEPAAGHDENVSDNNDASSSSLRPTGRVVGVVRRNFRRDYCGSVFYRDDSVAVDGSTRAAIASRHEREHDDGAVGRVFFAVDDDVPPVCLRLSRRRAEALRDERVLVAIDAWPAHREFPTGHYVATVGAAGDKHVETQVLLHEHEIPCAPFSEKVLACLPPAHYAPTLKDDPDRLDLRHLPVLSIDPPGCQDIDDALHCHVLPNGNLGVGVHIADVTHYVKPNTEIDREAANRSTSTYLVDRRLDMLPKLLTTDLCSLRSNVDRYAFSVMWEVTPDTAEIVNVDFRKTIVHSVAALTYQEAQAFLDRPDDADADVDKNDPDRAKIAAVKRLASLARTLRARRVAAGALTLASPEVKFTLDDESLHPTDVRTYAVFEANALVEEFMLLANVTVGKKILRHYPTLSVLRRHPSPDRTMFDSLVSKAAVKGFTIDVSDSKRLADSLDAAVDPDDPYVNRLVRILSTRCMAPARYFVSGDSSDPREWHHYGLAAPVYTHFTSPIRRYADVCVHRLLAASVGAGPLPTACASRARLRDLAANMNRRHRAAQTAGRASVQLHTLLFFDREKDRAVETAYVLDATNDDDDDGGPSFAVLVPRYGIEGRVRLGNERTKGGRFVLDAEHHRLTYTHDDDDRTVSSVQVLDRVRVRIWVRTVPETRARELVLDPVEPAFGNTDDATTIATTTTTTTKRRRDEDPEHQEKRAKAVEAKRKRDASPSPETNEPEGEKEEEVVEVEEKETPKKRKGKRSRKKSKGDSK